MAKVQTRRNVSVSAETYARLKAYCEASGVSMSGVVEARVKEVLDKGPAHEDLMADQAKGLTVIDEAKKLTPQDYRAIRRFR